MSGETIAITGANRGIGLELVRLFLARSDRVIALCREAGNELSATSAEVIEGVDVTAPESLRAVAPRLKGEPIDVLVNVAGVLTREGLEDLGEHEALERIRNQFEVNALGPLLATHALLDSLGEGAKVALITSRMGSIADNDSGGRYGYRMSKAALNAAGKSLAVDLAGRGVAVGIFHPGFVRTAMTGYRGHVEPREAASMLLVRIDELDLAHAGRFVHANGEVLPW